MEQTTTRLDWPLMRENITAEDLGKLREFLMPSHAHGVPRLTHGQQVRKFEEEFAQGLGTKYAVMVNSGASANLLSMQAIRIFYGAGEVLVPCITWVSDIAAVLHAGLEPRWVDIDPRTLGMDAARAKRMATARTQAVFLTHCLGFRCERPELPSISVVEDCCESLGATDANGEPLGAKALMANFSFYYAHHMSTIEGGMITTNNERYYQLLRSLRSHGLAREMDNPTYREAVAQSAPDCDPEFIFMHPAYNVRPTELNAVLGRAQLPRLDYMNARRTANLVTFLNNLDPGRYRTNYRIEGSSNYALPLILVEPDEQLMANVLALLRESGVEYRRGTAGGGNQLRQPYAKERWGDNFHKKFPQAEHVHRFGLYIGNYPSLDEQKIKNLCSALNEL